MKYFANSMDVRITKVDERKRKVTGHNPDVCGHFDIGTLILCPYDSDKPDENLVVSFEPDVAQAEDVDGTTWLEARTFTAKELRELADLMDTIGKAAAAEGLDIVAEQGIATAVSK